MIWGSPSSSWNNQPSCQLPLQIRPGSWTKPKVSHPQKERRIFSHIPSSLDRGRTWWKTSGVGIISSFRFFFFTYRFVGGPKPVFFFGFGGSVTWAFMKPAWHTCRSSSSCKQGGFITLAAMVFSMRPCGLVPVPRGQSSTLRVGKFTPSHIQDIWGLLRHQKSSISKRHASGDATLMIWPLLPANLNIF